MLLYFYICIDSVKYESGKKTFENTCMKMHVFALSYTHSLKPCIKTICSNKDYF